jgi:hypothetical protein
LPKRIVRPKRICGSFAHRGIPRRDARSVQSIARSALISGDYSKAEVEHIVNGFGVR